VHRPGLDITDDAAPRKNFVGYGGRIARDVELRGFAWAKDRLQCQFYLRQRPRSTPEQFDRCSAGDQLLRHHSVHDAESWLHRRDGGVQYPGPADRRIGASVGCRRCGCQSAVERGFRLSSISCSNADGRTGQVDRGEQGADDGAHQPDLEPDRVLRFWDRICRGRAGFWRTFGTNSKPWSAHSVSSSRGDNTRPSRPPRKAG